MAKLVKEYDYLDLDKLMKDYSPLMKSIYKKFAKFNNLYHSSSDYEDLEAQIQFEFVKLCSEYNPTRGVDFPGFIKFHLQQRVFHYVTKLQKSRQKETVAYSRDYDGEQDESVDFDNMSELIDEQSKSEFDRIEALASLDWSVIQSEKQRYLVKAILYEYKSIEELAKEEGVSNSVVRLNTSAFHFVLLTSLNLLKPQFYQTHFWIVHL